MKSAIIAAAGSGTRMHSDTNKVLMLINNKPVIYYTVSAFKEACVDEIIVVASENDIKDMEEALTEFKGGIKLIRGGKTRQESVLMGLKASSGDIVCIHDGARAFITPELILKTIDDCTKFGAAAPGVKIKDTVKKATTDGYISSTVDRELLYLIQTPQVFKRDDILDCHMRALEADISVTDDCSLLEAFGLKVYITEGSYDNIKLTTPEDIVTGTQILKKREGITKCIE